jgi:hypothetical protein
LIGKNKLTDLEPLVSMCRKDAESDRRFAPYLEVYLGENPIDEKKLAEQMGQLKAVGVRVFQK